MATKGFECTGIKEILDTALVTRSNFYYHFHSKEELCLAALEVMQKYYLEEVINKSLSNHSLVPSERLNFYCQLIVDNMIKNCCKAGCPFINLGNETSDFHPSFRQKISAINDQQISALADCINAGIDRGDFHPDLVPRKAAIFIMATINGSILLSKIYKDPIYLEDNILSIQRYLKK